jgi:hypothetical protein
MRRLAAFALLPLIGAAPLPQAGAGAAVECRLPYADTGKASAGLNLTRSSGEDPNAEGGVAKYYGTAGVTVLGQPATAYVETEFVASGVHRKIFRADLVMPFADARAAMLKLHNKASCDAHENTKPGELDCMIHVREESGSPARDVDMALFELDGAVAVGCI